MNFLTGSFSNFSMFQTFEMPTPIKMTRQWLKSENVWLKSWKKPSLDPNSDLPKHLKKLIKYYPKNFKALKLLTPEAEGDSVEPSQEVLQLKKALYAKYNKRYLLHIDLPEDPQNIEKLERVNLVSLSSLKISEREFRSVPRNHLRSLKYVDSLEIKTKNYSRLKGSHMKYVRKIRSITSLTLHNLHPLPLRKYFLLFRHLWFRLKSLTIKGMCFYPSGQNREQFARILWFFLSFPNLKVVHLDVNDPITLNIGVIPLDVLKQKGTKFDIRLNHLAAEESPVSAYNSQVLSDIQVLGLNTQFCFTQLEAIWDCIEEAHLDIQKNAKGNLFYLNQIHLDSASLLSLTNICKNISTLNLILNSQTDFVDFAALTELSNLQNFFVQFYEIQKPLISLFKGLESLVQIHKKLEFASFEFLGGRIGEDYAIVEPFFEASRDVLKKVIFKLRLINEDLSGIKYFYQGLQKLNQLTSLSLLIHETSVKIPCCTLTQNCTCHYNLLANLLENLNGLTEVNLSLPNIHQEKNLFINFNISKPIKKLSLVLPEGKTCESLMNNLAKLAELRQLDLTIYPGSENTWKNLYQIILRLDMLEVLRLKLDSDPFTISLEDFKSLMEIKKKLKFIVLGKLISAQKRECFVFERKDYREEDIDGFLAIGEYGMPPKVFPKKTFFFE